MDRSRGIQHHSGATGLAEILERVLDKGVVIAGDINISIAEIELISVKIRLVVCSVDKAREMGINWWQHDPYLSKGVEQGELDAPNEDILRRIEALEKKQPKKK